MSRLKKIIYIDNKVNPEQIAQMNQSANRLEENKEQRVNNIIARTDKGKTTGCREEERLFPDHF